MNRFSFSLLLFFLPILVALALGGTLLGRDPDLAVHLVYGRAVLAEGPWLSADPTLLRGGTPVLHEWLTEGALALIERCFGLGPFLLLAPLVQSVILVHLYRRGLQHGFWSAFVSALVAYGATATAFTVRPHLVSWLLFYLLLATMGQRRSWWQVWALGVVWVNLHVMAVLLPIVLLCELITTRRGWAPLAASLVALLCNPWGWGLWAHVVQVALGPNPARDCGPPDFGVTGTAWVYLCLFALALLLVVHQRRTSPALVLLLVGTAGAAGLQMRNLPYFGLVVAVASGPTLQYLVRHLPDSFGPREREALVPVRLMATSLVVLFLGVTVLRPTFAGDHVPPSALVSWAAGPGYSGWNSSGYVLHSTNQPQYLHSLNANVEDWASLHADQQVLDLALPGWATLLDAQELNWVLVQRGMPLALALDGAAGWRLAAAEEQWRMFVRTGEPLAGTR